MSRVGKHCFIIKMGNNNILHNTIQINLSPGPGLPTHSPTQRAINDTEIMNDFIKINYVSKS